MHEHIQTTQQQSQQSQQNQERKLGTLRSWNLDKGFGIIVVGPSSSLEKYFLHVSKVKSGTATPTPGMLVYFRVSDKPVKEDRLPLAVDAHIDVNSVAPVDSSTGAAR